MRKTTNKLKLCFYLCLKRLNLLPSDIIATQELHYIRGIEKQLDEYRELLEDIERRTGYFSSPQGLFSVNHASTLDDYLTHLYKLRYSTTPDPRKPKNALRNKPPFIPSKN